MSAPISVRIPPVVLQVLELFREDLEAVPFPDVDRARLDELEGILRTHEARLETLREQLSAAEREADEAAQQLQAAARRGLAYAKVYADSRPELQARIAGLDETPAKAPPSKRRRKRPPPAPPAKAPKLPLLDDEPAAEVRPPEAVIEPIAIA